MQKLSACRNRRSEIQRRRSTSSSCMIAICPAGPPKLMQPSFSQKRKASDSEGRGLAVIARDDRERTLGRAVLPASLMACRSCPGTTTTTTRTITTMPAIMAVAATGTRTACHLPRGGIRCVARRPDPQRRRRAHCGAAWHRVLARQPARRAAGRPGRGGGDPLLGLRGAVRDGRTVAPPADLDAPVGAGRGRGGGFRRQRDRGPRQAPGRPAPRQSRSDRRRKPRAYRRVRLAGRDRQRRPGGPRPTPGRPADRARHHARDPQDHMGLVARRLGRRRAPTPSTLMQDICLRINEMEVGMDEIVPDAEAWAIAHDFTPTESEPNGATPLLREGMMGIAATSYAGYVLGRDATLYEFSVGSPTVSDAFGGGGVDGSWFTLFLVPIDDSGFRRLTVHPKKQSDRDWWNRLLGRDDVRETGDVDFDEHHQVIASSDLDNERFAELVGSDLISLMHANTDLLVEVERSEQGDAALLVALPGIGIGDEGLDRLLAATEHVVGLF